MSVADDEAQRTAVVSSFFYFLGDVLKGADGSGAPDRGWQRGDRLMGPPTESGGLYLGADGRWYPRGSAVPAAAAAAGAASTPAGFTITPGMLLLAGIAFLILRK
jgi:hypothetical protein